MLLAIMHKRVKAIVICKWYQYLASTILLNVVFDFLSACYLYDNPSSASFESSYTYSEVQSSSNQSPQEIPAPVMSYSQIVSAPLIGSPSPRSMSPTGSESSSDSAFSIASPTSTTRHGKFLLE